MISHWWKRSRCYTSLSNVIVFNGHTGLKSMEWMLFHDFCIYDKSIVLSTRFSIDNIK